MSNRPNVYVVRHSLLRSPSQKMLSRVSRALLTVVALASAVSVASWGNSRNVNALSARDWQAAVRQALRTALLRC